MKITDRGCRQRWWRLVLPYTAHSERGPPWGILRCGGLYSAGRDGQVWSRCRIGGDMIVSIVWVINGIVFHHSLYDLTHTSSCLLFFLSYFLSLPPHLFFFPHYSLTYPHPLTPHLRPLSSPNPLLSNPHSSPLLPLPQIPVPILSPPSHSASSLPLDMTDSGGLPVGPWSPIRRAMRAAYQNTSYTTR